MHLTYFVYACVCVCVCVCVCGVCVCACVRVCVRISRKEERVYRLVRELSSSIRLHDLGIEAPPDIRDPSARGRAVIRVTPVSEEDGDKAGPSTAVGTFDRVHTDLRAGVARVQEGLPGEGGAASGLQLGIGVPSQSPGRMGGVVDRGEGPDSCRVDPRVVLRGEGEPAHQLVHVGHVAEESRVARNPTQGIGVAIGNHSLHCEIAVRGVQPGGRDCSPLSLRHQEHRASHLGVLEDVLPDKGIIVTLLNSGGGG